jgi:hypothetical protein
LIPTDDKGQQEIPLLPDGSLKLVIPIIPAGEGTPVTLKDWEAAMEVLMEEITPRESLAWFARRMENKLRQNDHKPGWEGLNDSYFLKRASQEYSELMQAVAKKKGPEEIIDECADLANFVMMLATNQRNRAVDIDSFRGRRD